MSDRPERQTLEELVEEHRDLFEDIAEIDDPEIARKYGEKPLSLLEE